MPKSTVSFPRKPSPELLEVGRRAVEDALLDMRDARISTVRNNGLVVKERDGSPSSLIRMGPEQAFLIAFEAMVKELD